MTQIINLLASMFPYLRHGFFTVMGLLLISLSSCSKQYYLTNSTDKIYADTLVKLNASKKIFIVHTSANSFVLENMEVREGILSGDRQLLNPKFERYLNPKTDSSNLILIKDKKAVLEEVHIYTSDSFYEDYRVSLNINQIYRMDVYTVDPATIHRSIILSIAGIILIKAVSIGVMAATNSGPVHYF
jgi:hypothetical protein